MSEGIVYLIQPSELVGTERYKLGCSGKSCTQRLSAYKKGTRVLCVNLVKKPFFVEKKLKESFLQEFDVVAGNEYFITNDERKMYLKFHEIVGKYFDAEEISFDSEEPSSNSNTTNSVVQSPSRTTIESDSDSDFYVESSSDSDSDTSNSDSISSIIKRYYESSDSDSESSDSGSEDCYCKITYKSQDQEERERLITMLSEIVKTYNKYVVIDHDKCIGCILFMSGKFNQLRNNFVTKIRNYKKKNNIVLSGKFNYMDVTRNVNGLHEKVKGRVIQKKNMSGF